MTISLNQNISGSNLGSTIGQGFPVPPNGKQTDFFDNTRHVPIPGTTDSIRLPLPSSTLTKHGYRRVDKNGSGAASEWFITWDEISQAVGIDSSTLVSSWNFGKYQIIGNDFHMHIYRNTTSVPNNFMITANLQTAEITQVKEIKIINSFLYYLGMNQLNHWEILPDGRLYVLDGINTTNDWMRYCIFDSTYSTVLEQEFLMFNPQVNNLIVNSRSVKYATKDKSLFVFDRLPYSNPGVYDNRTMVRLYSPEHGLISISTNTLGISTSSIYSYVAFSVLDAIALPYAGNYLSDNYVAVAKQHMEPGTVASSQGIGRTVFDRDELDDWLKKIYEVCTGVQL